MRKKIFAICGSSRKESLNLQIIRLLQNEYHEHADIEICTCLDQLPHFNPDLDSEELLPKVVRSLRKQILLSDGVLMCTPEYVFSLPGCLKNFLEWMVSSMVFTDKPVALVTASTSSIKAHESLLLIMNTIGSSFNDKTQLLISGIGKKSENLFEEEKRDRIEKIFKNFLELIEDKYHSS